MKYTFLGLVALFVVSSSCARSNNGRQETASDTQYAESDPSAPQVVRLQGFEYQGDGYVSTVYFLFDDKGRVRGCNVLGGEPIFVIDWESHAFYPYFGSGTFKTDANGRITALKVKGYEDDKVSSATFTYDAHGRLASWGASGAQGRAGGKYKRDAEGRIVAMAENGEAMRSVKGYVSYDTPNKHGLHTVGEADFLFRAQSWGDAIPALFEAGLLGAASNFLITGEGSEENNYEVNADGLITKEEIVSKDPCTYLYADDFTVSDGYVGEAIATTSRIRCKTIREEY